MKILEKVTPIDVYLYPPLLLGIGKGLYDRFSEHGIGFRGDPEGNGFSKVPLFGPCHSISNFMVPSFSVVSVALNAIPYWLGLCAEIPLEKYTTLKSREGVSIQRDFSKKNAMITNMAMMVLTNVLCKRQPREYYIFMHRIVTTALLASGMNYLTQDGKIVKTLSFVVLTPIALTNALLVYQAAGYSLSIPQIFRGLVTYGVVHFVVNYWAKKYLGGPEAVVKEERILNWVDEKLETGMRKIVSTLPETSPFRKWYDGPPPSSAAPSATPASSSGAEPGEEKRTELRSSAAATKAGSGASSDSVPDMTFSQIGNVLKTAAMKKLASYAFTKKS